jgi:hypothetical protein
MVAGIRMKRLASVTALLVLAAQLVIAYEVNEDSSATAASVTTGLWDSCEDKGPYHNKLHYTRKGKSIWLRCGKYGSADGVIATSRKAHGWGVLTNWFTGKTVMKGKKIAQDKKGSYRYIKKFKDDGDTFKWRVVVQHTKTYSGEPKPKLPGGLSMETYDSRSSDISGTSSTMTITHTLRASSLRERRSPSCSTTSTSVRSATRTLTFTTKDLTPADMTTPSRSPR